MAKVSGTIAGQNIEGYIRSCRRRAHLCNPGQTVTLIIDPSFPIDPQPSDPIVLYENDTLVLTGYVQKVTLSKPSFDWIVEGMDTYQRAQSFFIEDPLIVGHDPITDQPVKNYTPLTTDYWIAYLLGLCGASYAIQPGGYSVPQGVQLGLRTVHESLQDIMAYSSQYAWPKPDGTIEVKRVTRNSADYTLSTFTDFEYRKDDEWTRTTVKVFGGSSGYGSRQQNVFASASASLANIIPDRVAAVATPMIQSYAEAQRVADYMISELGDVTWVATGTIVGNPDIHIGQSARMTYLDFDRTDVITSLETDWDENGYLMQVTIGERCPRISGWARISPPIYAGTTQHGVYKSTDGGINWTEFNTGLPTGFKSVRKLGFNADNEGMAIVNETLWYTDGLSNSWVQRYLPSPVNDAGDSPALGYGRMIAVDATGVLGGFSVLTTSGSVSTGSEPAQTRSWIYSCTNGGATAGDWSSVQMTTGSATANPYNLTGHDLTASGGTPMAVLSSGSCWASVPINGWRVEKITADRNAFDYFSTSQFRWKCDARMGLSWHVNSIENFGPYGDGYTVIKINIITPQTFGRGSWVYLYGCYGDRNDFAVMDSQGYLGWGFTSDAYLIGVSTESGVVGTITNNVWQTRLQYPNSDPLPLFGWRTIYFNIFCLARGSLPPNPSLTHGDTCGDDHVMGSSPYGDRYHPGMPSNLYRMPIRSTLLAGTIFWA